MLHAVVMAGGSGTRFWPQSRKNTPKQLLRLSGSRTMIQETLARCEGWIDPRNSWVVTNGMQAPETARQLPQVPSDQILIEPCARNTAPCLGLAAIRLLHDDPDAVMFVMPADHVISTPAQFQQAGAVAEQLVRDEPARFVLFGVPPTFPATGYGYIERGDPLPGVAGFHVRSFREKPDLAVAEEYVSSGNYYWNCGIFCWRAEAILDALRQFEPEMHAGLMRLAESIGTTDWEETLATEFPRLRSVSVDHAVLERAENVAVVEAPFLWDDVGSWLSLPRLLGKDAAGNTIDAPHCGINSEGCIIRSTEDHLIATVGMKDCIVVHTPDATLVANRQDADSMRQLVALLAEQGFADRL